MASTRSARTRGAGADDAPKKRKTRIARTHGALENLKRGRPTDYSHELVEVVRIMSRGGATVFEIAQALGITTQTLHNWAANYQEFFDALYKEGRAAFDERIKRTMADLALGYSFESEKVFANGQRMSVVEHVPPNPVAAKHWLSVRDPEWAERQKIDLDAKVETSGTDEERTLALAVLAMLTQAAGKAGGDGE